jgi:hypothetical protein
MCCDCGDDGEEMREPWDTNAMHSLIEAEQEQAFLFLRPIAQITDEEAIEVAKMGGYRISFTMPPNDIRKLLMENVPNDTRWTTLGSHTVDYLRSIGIALPFMGHSVQELCDAGWIKLITP